jgi:toxin ParE1/3/4
MKVRFSRRALSQLDEIFGYIVADNPRAAAAVVDRIDNVVALIGRNPAIGRPTDKRDVRVFRPAEYPYLIFYRWDRERGEVTVLRIRHTSRQGDWRKGR